MSTPSPQNPGLTNWLLIGALGLIWGGAFMSVRLSLDGFGPWTVAAGRTALGALSLAVIGAVLGQGMHKIPSPRAWKFSTIIGAGAIALPFALLSWGQQFVPSAFAGVAMGAVPLLVLPLVYLFSPEEGIGPRRILGMILGFIGLFILIGPGAAASTGEANEWLGRLACLGAAACYACGSVVTRCAPKMPPIAFATASLAIAAAILVPIALIFEGLPRQFPTNPTLALVYAALMPTALAAVIRVSGGSGLHRGHDAANHRRQLPLVAAFGHDADQRLCARLANEKPSVALQIRLSLRDGGFDMGVFQRRLAHLIADVF